MESILIVSMVLLWALVLLNLALTLGLARRIEARLPAMHRPRMDPLDIGEAAPEFEARTLTDAVVSRSTYAGKIVALVFISPDCAPCREALPALAALRARAEQAGIEIVVVSDGNAAETRLLANDLEGNLPILVAPRESNSVFSDYKVSATPSFYLIGVSGRVQASGIGVAELKEHLNPVLRQAAPNTAQPDLAQVNGPRTDR